MEQTTGQQAYPGYGSFVIEQRNGNPQDSGAHWRIVAAAGQASPEDPAYPRFGKRHPDLAGATAEIRSRLEAERQRLLERAAGCLEQIEAMDAMYAPQPTPGQAIRAQRDQLLDCLRRFKAGEKVGHMKFKGFSLALPYLHSKDILVVTLPEYDPISPRFLPSDVELLAGIVAEAGFTDVDNWNGAGCCTVSFKLPVAQVTNQQEPHAEVAG